MQQQQHNNNHSLNPIRSMDEPFPLKLHRLLEDVEHKAKAEILAWDPDGRSFTIFQPKAFAESIMGQYFRQTKYKSFQRQMNLYGFVREVRGKIRGVYSHPQFMRNDRDLCLQIKRSNRPLAKSFGASLKNSIAFSSVMETGEITSNSNNTASASIDVSSPLFAPLNTIPPSRNSNINSNAINIGLASTKSLFANNNNNTNNFFPSFTYPAGSFSSFSSANQISLDDEESMGTIDELPFSSQLFGIEEQQQQATTTTTTSEEFDAVAV